jgi:hypothetical protein
MPELPEVEMIVRDLRSKIVGRRILGVQTDWPKYFRLPSSPDKPLEPPDEVPESQLKILYRSIKTVLKKSRPYARHRHSGRLSACTRGARLR